jgi:hypothetical protein
VLSGNLPTFLGELTDLHSLDLSENQFEGSLPTELALLTSLFEFNLHQTKGNLGGQLPAFDTFPLLSQLNLESNHFEGSIPDNFLAMSDKTKEILVALGFNKLTGDIPSSLIDFAQLTLELEGNSITG